MCWWLATARPGGPSAALCAPAGVLEDLGCPQARLIVISVSDAKETELLVRRIHEASPGVDIVVRSQYEMDAGPLRVAGASEVISSEETSSAATVRAAVTALEDWNVEAKPAEAG